MDDDVGDFPTRCRRCGALLRRRGASSFQVDRAPPANLRTARIPCGKLAGLLISRSTSEVPAPPIIHAHTGSLVRGGPVEGAHAIPRPVSRREIHRARRQALRRAELTGSQQALGTLRWAGLALVALLTLGALVLKAQATWL